MRQIKIIGLILLSIASFIYGYQKPEKVGSTQKSEVYITLEGAFNKTGEVPIKEGMTCLLYTSPSPRDRTRSRMPSSA